VFALADIFANLSPGYILMVRELLSRYPAEPMPDFSRRIPQLDGLRGVAIGMVLVSQYINFAVEGGAPGWVNFFIRPTSLGWAGVDLFFVLSGFLIGGILLDAHTFLRVSSSAVY
jgi:peptidoglycan/LPS O-acetylase OafA/YrhL